MRRVLSTVSGKRQLRRRRAGVGCWRGATARMRRRHARGDGGENAHAVQRKLDLVDTARAVAGRAGSRTRAWSGAAWRGKGIAGRLARGPRGRRERGARDPATLGRPRTAPSLARRPRASATATRCRPRPAMLPPYQRQLWARQRRPSRYENDGSCRENDRRCRAGGCSRFAEADLCKHLGLERNFPASGNDSNVRRMPAKRGSCTRAPSR